MELMLGLKTVAAFLLVWTALILTVVAIRKIVDVVILGVFLGAAGLACFRVLNTPLLSWAEVVGVAAGIGVIAGLLCTVLFPFSSKGFQSPKTTPELVSPAKALEENGALEQVSKQDRPSTLNL